LQAKFRSLKRSIRCLGPVRANQLAVALPELIKEFRFDRIGIHLLVQIRNLLLVFFLLMLMHRSELQSVLSFPFLFRL